MTKHTPGPWQYWPSIGQVNRPGDPNQICNIPPNGDKKPADENDANARLIAAAPDLLAACEAAITWAKTPGPHGGNPYCHEFIKLAEAAIAKATS